MWQIWIFLQLFYLAEAWRYATEHDHYPFIVSLETQRGKRLCTGSLIGVNWVLTAAECMGFYPYLIRYSNFTANRGKIRAARVVKVIPHPAYYNQEGEAHNNIALVFVSAIDKILGRLSALDYNTLIGLPVIYAGFNVDGYERLRIGEGVVTPDHPYCAESCINVAPKCSEEEIYEGDLGGPLIYDGKIVGVAITEPDSAVIADFAVLSTSLGWIERTMKVKRVWEKWLTTSELKKHGRGASNKLST